MLPIEFARESEGRKITLVICDDVPRVQTLWTLLDAADIASARLQLGLREYAGATPKWIEANIGFWARANGLSYGKEGDTIAAWAAPRPLAGVVWTNLDYGFKDKALKRAMPLGEEIVAHLRRLEGVERSAAEEYVRRAPAQIDTPYRRLIVQEIGWI